MITVTDVGIGRAFNNGSATVTVSAVSTGSSPITSYTVTPSPATSPTTFTSSSPTITVTGLTSGTSYTYSVIASNSTDTSTPVVTTPVIATTVPAAPTIGAVTSTSYTTATVAFTAGATGGSPITGYTVTSSPAVPIITTGTTSPLSIVGDFVGGQAYTFTLTAQNANGSSLSSAASTSVNSLGPNTADIQASNKNKIFNGDFSLWSRGTTFASVVNGTTYTADRWISENSNSASGTVSRQAFTAGTAPVAGYEAPYFLRIVQTPATATQGIGNRIDDVRTFAGQTVTLSFWAKAAAATTLTALVSQNFGTGGTAQSDSITQAFSIGTTWQRYIVTGTVASIAGKTLGTNHFLVVRLLNLTNTTFTLDLWGVQLEAGAGATTFSSNGGTANLDAVTAGSGGFDGVLVSTNTATNPSGSGVNSWAGYQPAGKNLLLNGAFDFWERGVSQTTTGFSTADCWYGYISNTTTISQETTDLPVGARYGIKWATTSSSSSYGQFHQMIPSSVIIPLRGKILTFSYYAKVTSLTGNIQPEIQYSNSVVDAPYGAYTAVVFTGSAAAPTTWTRLTYTLTVPADAVSMRVGIIPVSAQTTNGATVRVANVQLEVGNTATQFARAGGSPNTEVAAIGAQGFDGVLVSTANTTNGINQSGWAGFNFAGKNAVINGGFDIWQRDTSSTSAITGVTAVGATTTYTATNTFVVGQTVSVSGVVSNANGLNGAATVTAASSTSFTINLVTIAGTTWVSGGSAYGFRVYTNPTNLVNAYCADRWTAVRGWFQPGISTHYAWSGGLPGGIPQAIKVQRTPGDTTTTYTTGGVAYPLSTYLGYSLETQDSLRFQGQYATISFYARAGANFSGTGNILQLVLSYGTGSDQNIFAGFTGSTVLANTNNVLTTNWQRFTATVFVPTVATQLAFYVQYVATGTAGFDDSFYVTGVQLELGTTPTVFSRAGGGNFSSELALCQRYFEVQDWTMSTTRVSVVYAPGSPAYTYTQWTVPKRTVPSSITWSSNGNARFVSPLGVVGGYTLTLAQNTQYGASVGTSVGISTACAGWLDNAGLMYIHADL